jgi:hypothetical protein
MKKIGVFFFLLVIGFGVFAQTNNDVVLEYALLIGKPVPIGFARQDRTHYMKQINDQTIILTVRDNTVISSSLGAVFHTVHEAQKWRAKYYNIMEQANWEFIKYIKEDGEEIYEKNNYRAFLTDPWQRIDGLIAIGIYLYKLIDNINLEFDFLRWLDKNVMLLGKRDTHNNDEDYIIDTYIMANDSRCTIYARNSNSTIKMVMISIEDKLGTDTGIIYDQLLEDIPRDLIKLMGSVDEDFLLDYNGTKILITQPENSFNHKSEMFLVFIIIYNE